MIFGFAAGTAVCALVSGPAYKKTDEPSQPLYHWRRYNQRASSGGNLALGMVSYINDGHGDTPIPGYILTISPGTCGGW